VPATSTKAGPPPGDKVGTGDGGPGSGSHGDKVCTSGTRQGGGGRTCGLALTRACTLLLALTLDNPRPSPDDPPPPRSPPTRGEPVGPEIETDGSRARTPPRETRGTPKGRDEAPVGEPPGLARDGPRCEGSYVALRVPAHATWLARRSMARRATRMTRHAPVRTGGAVGAGWDLD